MNMKKYIITLLILSIMVMTVSAQSPTISGANITAFNGQRFSSELGDGIYKIQSNNTINYFSFAISGTASGTNFIKFSSNYSWTTKNFSNTGSIINVTLKNEDDSWNTKFLFTNSTTKITNTIKNILPVDITNAKFYYVFTLNTGDNVSYGQGIYYTGTQAANIHKTENLNANPQFSINKDILFNFQDIIDTGFIVTDFYIIKGTDVGLPYAGNVVALGFTANNGVFPAGSTATIDPTITNGGFETTLSPWVFYTDGTGSASATAPGLFGSAKRAQISIDDAGTNTIFYYPSITLKADRVYRLNFSANNTNTDDVEITIFKGSSPYTDYGLYETLTLNPTVGNYSYEFTTIGFSGTVNDARLQFDFTSGASAGTLYNIDNVVLELAPYMPPKPVLNTTVKGNFYINTSWVSGSGNVTNGYNSTNGTTWINNTLNYRNTTLPPHGWQNLTIYAYNNTGYTAINATPLISNVQLDNNPVTLSNISPSYTLNIGQLLQIRPNATDADNDPKIFATSATKGTFYTTNGSLDWIPQVGDNGTYNWYINVSDANGSIDSKSFTVSINSQTPGNPLNIMSTTGNFYVNTSWESAINTNSFNISVNGSWINGSATSFINSTSLNPHVWNNVTVYGFNTTSKLLGNSTSLNTQLPNNAPTIYSATVSSASITTAQSLAISAINVSDLDNDNVTVNVSILFNLGGTTNYSMINTANTSNWTYSYSSSTVGSYTVVGIYINDNYTETAEILSHAFTVTAPATTTTTTGGGSSSVAPITYLFNNQTLNQSDQSFQDVILKIQSFAPTLPSGLQELIATCYMNNAILSGSCASTILLAESANWTPILIGAFIGAFFTILFISIVYKKPRGIFVIVIDTLLYGIVSMVVIQITVLVGINAYFVNYLTQSDLPIYLLVSTVLASIPISFLLDNMLMKKTRRN